MSRPTSHLDWVTDDDSAKIVDPGSFKKALGWVVRERPPARFFNWLFNKIDKWNKLVDASAPDVVCGAGTGCTHATLAAALADGALGANLRVLVKDAVTVNTSPTVLSKDGWDVLFAPGADLTKGTSTTGLQVTGDRVTIRGARFVGFSTAGDKAIEFAAGADYGRVMFCNFVGADTEVDDSAATAGRLPLQLGNISE